MDEVEYRGGCHCRRVRFRVRVRVGAGKPEALECNCSICEKKGFVHLIVTKDAFDLDSGGDALTTYTFNTKTAKHMFCSVCGMHPFYVPRSHPDGIDVNVRCLDGDALRQFRVVPFDGREWEANVETIR